MNIIFMGTPDFAVPSLEALINTGHNISCVFTNPDKPQGRGHKLGYSPVKEFALSKGMDIFQPVSLKKGADGEESLSLIKKLNPDAVIVAAYGKILPIEILKFPKYGCINVHASLLPKYRGAAPINQCIINGESKSGVSIMYMAEGIDTGDVILNKEFVIPDNMVSTELYNKLKIIGAALLTEALVKIENGTSERIPQNNGEFTYAPPITKETCRIDWGKPAYVIRNLIRGLSEEPAAFTVYEGKRLKIFYAELDDGEDIYGSDKKAGTIVDTENFTVLCGDKKTLRIKYLQLEGGKKMDALSFTRGRKPEKYTVLG